MFETIAVMEGDYDTGKTKVETLKDYLGEEGLKSIRQNIRISLNI